MCSSWEQTRLRQSRFWERSDPSGVLARIGICSRRFVGASLGSLGNRPARATWTDRARERSDPSGVLARIGICPRGFRSRLRPNQKSEPPLCGKGRLWEKGGAGGRHGPYVGTRARPYLLRYRSPKNLARVSKVFREPARGRHQPGVPQSGPGTASGMRTLSCGPVAVRRKQPVRPIRSWVSMTRQPGRGAIRRRGA
ncbi:MAG: hypothetical protein QOF45_1928 [Gaiellaceae bacterium]|nr:hypothetical protein [Gaiellaceae bacterium]